MRTRNGAQADTGAGGAAVVIDSKIGSAVMATLPAILLTVVGALLIVVALRDVFDVLFHEMGTAVLSHVVIRGVWRLFHKIATPRNELFTLAGPFALIAVVGTWAVLLIFGWA